MAPRSRPTYRFLSVAVTCSLAVSPLAAAETHLTEIRQLTRGGENAEAYWSPDGTRLVFQRTGPEGGCDQIFTMPVDGSGEPEQISSGQGRTTCGYYAHDGRGVLYSTTGLFAAECPAPPDRSRGYVWPVYDAYEIVVEPGDGTEPLRLTDNEAYDAEATVCPVDGSIVFTSDRDGDLELYRMNADGSDVRRLTEAPGYDGGAFFSPDCSRIVWRASRPQGAELEEYQALLTEGLVRPGLLELWVADADGSNARQITYLGAASFAPSFYPDGKRIVFSSNWSGGGREFDLWAIDVQGTRLERITDTPGFDGFPKFSPDGTRLAFGTNRFPGGPYETNVAVADWVEHEPAFEERASDRFLADVRWLADDAREGRGAGTEGLAAAGDWLEERFRDLGLAPGYGAGYRQPIEIPVKVRTEDGTRLLVDGTELALGEAWKVTGFSASGEAAAEVVPAGYGIVAPELERNDYEGLDVAGKIVLVRRFVPSGEAFEDPDAARRFGDIRYKAFTAREKGAVGLLVVDLPEGDAVDESPLPGLAVEQRGDAGIPVAVLTREAGRALFEGGHRADLKVRLAIEKASATNVVGRLPARGETVREGAIVVGAHYDHLGFGGSGSLAPESNDVHNGADDNASGTAALLETARILADAALARDVWFVAFAGEENGLVGSTRFTREPPPSLALDDTLAMLNFDMVGWLRDNRLQVLGGESAAEWREMLPELCANAGLECATAGDGYGPSDQTPFYAAGVPVLHFFTGAHDAYHKPADDWPLVNAAGGARIAALAADVVSNLAGRLEKLTYQEVEPPAPAGGDVRSYGASLGTIPDYVGPEETGKRGVLLAGVRSGSPAEKAGFQRGDLLVELAGREIGDIYDFMFVLRSARPGQEASAVVERDGERVTLTVIFGENTRMR